MQSINPSWQQLRHLWLAIGLLCAVLCGCNRPSADVAASGQDTANPLKSYASYELVLATRPEQPELYYKHIKPFYEICAVAAQVLKVPVKPFLSLPANFIVERHTMATDGKNRMDRKEGFGLGGVNPLLAPQTGCTTELGKSSITQVTFDGRRQDIVVSGNGAAEVFTSAELTEIPPRKAQDLRDYAVRKTALGVSLRCLDSTHPIISSKSLLEACIYDGVGGSRLLDEEGKVILVYSRQLAPVGNGGAANTLVTEPVRVSVGKYVDPSLFKLQVIQK